MEDDGRPGDPCDSEFESGRAESDDSDGRDGSSLRLEALGPPDPGAPFLRDSQKFVNRDGSRRTLEISIPERVVFLDGAPERSPSIAGSVPALPAADGAPPEDTYVPSAISLGAEDPIRPLCVAQKLVKRRGSLRTEAGSNPG
ncbi:MAG: hypothetical protein CL927_10085 [Deltaproteobacteria bacterium]|nr:hypothetical protein [Deltaproteobacteria bacterium]HCH63149.1 hypothetical protein [Deltaproteobacteria bacterium]